MGDLNVWKTSENGQTNWRVWIKYGETSEHPSNV